MERYFLKFQVTSKKSIFIDYEVVRCEPSFYHFENAHVLGQKHIIRHTISHYYMLVFGIKINSFKEIIGQVIRIIAALLFTFIWVPRGNTGGSNSSPIKIMPIRTALKKYF